MRKFILKLSWTLILLAMQALGAQEPGIGGNNLSTDKPGIFIIDSERSLLKISVYRAGFLSQMGHNHIVISKDITGQMSYTPGPDSSSATFSIPVKKLIVDDESERRVAGKDFESVPSESDIQSTRINMLSTAVLDGDNYPEITVHVNGVVNKDSLNDYSVRLEFKESQVDLNLHAYTQFHEDTMLIDADFELAQSQLNLKPFSVLGGMLKLAEQLRFKLHIEAIHE